MAGRHCVRTGEGSVLRAGLRAGSGGGNRPHVLLACGTMTLFRCL